MGGGHFLKCLAEALRDSRHSSLHQWRCARPIWSQHPNSPLTTYEALHSRPTLTRGSFVTLRVSTADVWPHMQQTAVTRWYLLKYSVTLLRLLPIHCFIEFSSNKIKIDPASSHSRNSALPFLLCRTSRVATRSRPHPRVSPAAAATTASLARHCPYGH